MIHTFEISYELSLKDANTCAWTFYNRITDPEPKLKGRISNFLNIEKKSKPIIFTFPELTGIRKIEMKKYEERNRGVTFRIYFMIEAEVLRTGTETLDLYTCSPEHFKQLQTQYAKAIYNLFGAEAFAGRPASLLYSTDFAPKESYAEEEFQLHSGLFSLGYLPFGSIKRLDFTYDVIRSSPEDAKLFTYMVQQSYYDGQKKQEKKGKQRNLEAEKNECFDKEYASGSRAFSVYYKYDEFKDKKYDSRQNIAQIRDDARNIVRIELPNFNPGRAKIKSATWLQVPDDSLPLGPLPYLANEQVPRIAFFKEYDNRVGNGPDLKWYKRTKLNTELGRLKRQHMITANAHTMMRKISQAIAQGRSQRYSHPLAKAITAFKENGEIVLHKQRDPITKKQILETFKCTYGQYNRYRKLAMDNGIMLVTIPDSKKLKELSALTELRNYESGLLGSQIITHMLPYQSVVESAPELEPVKDLYDAILEFLYGLYDQYAASHNTNYEAAKICPGDPRYPSDILEE